MSVLNNSLKGAGTSLVSSFFSVVFFAYTYRVPIPLGGYIGPFGDLNPYALNVLDVLSGIAIAWLAYGLFGGFMVLTLLGAITGAVIGKIFADRSKKTMMIVITSTVASFITVFGLSILDYLIGPW